VIRRCPSGWMRPRETKLLHTPENQQLNTSPIRTSPFFAGRILSTSDPDAKRTNSHRIRPTRSNQAQPPRAPPALPVRRSWLGPSARMSRSWLGPSARSSWFGRLGSVVSVGGRPGQPSLAGGRRSPADNGARRGRRSPAAHNGARRIDRPVKDGWSVIPVRARGSVERRRTPGPFSSPSVGARALSVRLGSHRNGRGRYSQLGAGPVSVAPQWVIWWWCRGQMRQVLARLVGPWLLIGSR
jgi:hypothetical protein